ncbi:ATPase family AAA domain-containing protein 3B [Pleurostoma richardsiae]|uniref:ATPase family AAA domain-containing protein 3B n=1 Tax=Pleurostoma richardsiae TaxID=41990 RepID=A0AA38RPP9_9PEZI|nr:ATPase family AAA domain-containing protein 3B [Pleurostoma richardsiae]
MAGNNEMKVDDASSSTASFEEIGPSKSASGDKVSTLIKGLIAQDARFGGPAVRSKEAPNYDEDVPDVLYVVQYRDIGGRIVDTRQSDKPLDLSADSNEDEASKRKPVIEILTQVSASPNKGRGRRMGGRRRWPHMPYSPQYSDSDMSDDEGNDMNVTKVETTVMAIHSKHLKDALNAVIGYYPGTNFMGDSVTIDAPYHALIHHRDALARYKTAQPACHDSEYVATTAKHIDVLLGFLDKTFGEKIRDELERHKNKPPAATFEWYWLLLKPGEVVYSKIKNVWTPFMVSRVDHVMGSGNRLNSYTIQCWNIRYRHGKMKRNMESFNVRTFSGEQAIHSLSVIPAAFLPDDLKEQEGLTMAEKQIQLGKQYWELVKRPTYKEYDGDLVERDGCLAGKLTGRVIVDVEGYELYGNQGPDGGRRRMPPPPGRDMPSPHRDQLPQFAARCSCKPCSKQGDREETGEFAGFEDLNPNKDTPPKNDVYFLVCSNDIPAFILGERRWGHIYVGNLKEVKSDREAFKYLVLDDEIKLTVKALIGKFASMDGKVSPWPHDFVKNKGEGRIFLLHGSPGVGKTCTAECVAELTHRPLLSLTSGDISSSMSPSSVERNLHYFLQLGERYGALVLLDEADVYLEERRAKDLRRNGLVSIFLRALEYYRGVLFLTTNRVGAFDSAFTSRIHVALHYRRLGDADRLRVWANNFDRLERDSGGRAWVSRGAREFATSAPEVRALRWNGREIRNALQTAVALAETEALDDGLERVTVAEKHLRAVVKMSRGFKEFLRKRRGSAEEEDEGEESGEENSDDGIPDDSSASSDGIPFD